MKYDLLLNDISKRRDIKDIPKNERPRERLLERGASSLSVSELIAIILSSGSKKESVLDITERLVNKYNSLQNLMKVSIDELLAIDGIGVAKACKLIAIFELSRRTQGISEIKSVVYDSSQKISKLLNPYLLNKTKEHFIVCSLDSRYKLIGIDNISIGTVNETLVHPREVFEVAINKRASFIILAHNHPSGDKNPSNDDINITKNLDGLSKLMGIPILDHIIITDNGYLSFKDKNLF